MSVAVIPFLIAVTPTASGGYTVRASAQGAAASAELELPPELAELAAQLRSGARPPLNNLAERGRQLGQALFAPAIHQLLLQTARTASGGGARLQIQIQIAAPELAALPWEWLALGNSTPWRPAVREDYALVRVTRAKAAPKPLPLGGPLRVLAVAARGEDPLLDALEEALTHEAGVELRLLRGSQAISFEQTLEREPFHVLHLAAPVEMTRLGATQLMLGRGTDAFALARTLGDDKTLRLVTVAGGQGDRGLLVPAVGALAATLLDDVLPATLALSAGMPPAHAAQFAALTYAALARGEPVDLAVTAARAALAQQGRAWGVPQLRLIPGAERLFSVRAASRQRAAVDQSRAAASAVTARVSALAQRARPAAPEPAQPARSTRPVRTEALDDVARATMRADREAARAQPKTPRAQPDVSATPQRAASIRRTASPPISQRAAKTGRVASRGKRQLPLGRAGLLFGVLLLLLLVGYTLTRPATTTPAPDAVPAAQPTAAPTAPPAAVIVKPQRYASVIANDGDTFASLAAATGSEPKALAAANLLKPDDPIRAGRPLIVPIYKGDAAPEPVEPVRHGDTSRPLIAITFDIEIDPETLISILDTLKARKLKATFFLTGNYVNAFPEASRRIVAEGHEVGNHSMTHPYFSKISAAGALSEVQQTETALRQQLGRDGRPYFRFPYGDSTPEMIKIVTEQGYVPYHWTADDAAIEGFVARAEAQPTAAYGGILLMHGRPSTVQQLPGWLDRLAAVGLTPTTLGALLK